MQSTETVTAPSGQKQVFDAWRSRLHGREFITNGELDIASIRGELAYMSVLESHGDSFRFRLAGTGLQLVLGGEARGRLATEIDICRGGQMWTELAARALARLAPVSGVARTPCGMIHFWLRLPMSSDGKMADLVLCHDRYLPADCLVDPDRAAREADRALRLDAEELVAA